MKKLFFLLLPAVCILCAFQPKPTEIDTKAVSDEVTKIENEWLAANRVQDVNKTMSFYAADATVMNQGEPVAIGYESIRKSTEAGFKEKTMLWKSFTLKIEKIELSEDGDLVLVRSSYTFQVKLSGGILHVKGKQLDIFKKVNGVWKFYITMFNRDM